MIYRLPKEQKALPKDITVKVSSLTADKQKQWYVKFDDCKPDKELYENLLKEIQKGNIQPNTIQDQKYLEEKITAKENELMQFLNEPINATDLEKAIEKAKALSGQGSVSIRPSAAKYVPPRKERQKK